MRVKRDKLDILFSKYMRLKTNGVCECCLQTFPMGKLQVAHFFGRRYKALRWDEENVSVLCFSCHQHFHEQPLEYVEWFKARLGGKFDLLQVRARVTAKYVDKELIELYLQAKIKEIK